MFLRLWLHISMTSRLCFAPSRGPRRGRGCDFRMDVFHRIHVILRIMQFCRQTSSATKFRRHHFLRNFLYISASFLEVLCFITAGLPTLDGAREFWLAPQLTTFAHQQIILVHWLADILRFVFLALNSHRIIAELQWHFCSESKVCWFVNTNKS